MVRRDPARTPLLNEEADNSYTKTAVDLAEQTETLPAPVITSESHVEDVQNDETEILVAQRSVNLRA